MAKPKTQMDEAVMPSPQDIGTFMSAWGAARTYVAQNNPDNAWYPGVPLRDLEQAEAVEVVPEWLHTTILALNWWSSS